jgi:hypothetical protein
MSSNLSLFIIVVIGALLNLLAVNGEGHHYHAHDRVSLVANTVGPYNNPTETYPVYHFIKFCYENFAHLFIYRFEITSQQ